MGVVLLTCCLPCLSCNNHSGNEQQASDTKSTESLEKENILKLAKDTAFKRYGDIIETELPLRAKLVGDSVWIVEGTLPKNYLGGTVYIEISKQNKSVVKITHFK